MLTQMAEDYVETILPLNLKSFTTLVVYDIVTNYLVLDGFEIVIFHFCSLTFNL